MRKLLLGIFCTTALAFPADFLSFGVKGGVPLNDAFNTASTGQIRYVTNTKRYAVGPELDINLPLGLGIEIDALYRRLNFESTSNQVDIFVRRATTANAWDFPLLLKWRLAPGPIKPYFSVGPTFRGLSNLTQRVETFFAPSRPQRSETTTPAELENRFNTGFTIGGGLQLGGPRVKLSPEIRYTRWGWQNFRSVNGLLSTNPDQVEFLVGLTF